MVEDDHSKAKSIGEFVKKLAEEANLSPTAFGKKINTSLNNAKDIYKRTSIDSELLLQISKELNKNVFSYYDDKEPIASLRKAEIESLRSEIDQLKHENGILKSLIQKNDLIIGLQSKYIAELEEKLKK